MKTINQKLEITPEQHETMIFELYDRWCQSVSTTSREYQQILANSAINTWFLMELTKCEKEFHNRTNRYTNTNVTASDFANCYRECTEQLFNYRPMVLLLAVKTKSLKGVQVFNVIYAN